MKSRGFTCVSSSNGRRGRHLHLAMVRILRDRRLSLLDHDREVDERVNNVFEALLEILREIVIRPWYLAWERRRGRRR